MPRFHVCETFSINDRATFVIAGHVVEGEVVPGMLINIPYSSSINMTAKIDRVDIFTRADGDIVSLGIHCPIPDEVTLWEALKLAGRTIEITCA